MTRKEAKAKANRQRCREARLFRERLENLIEENASLEGVEAVVECVSESVVEVSEAKASVCSPPVKRENVKKARLSDVDVQAVERIVGVTFQTRKLLVMALTAPGHNMQGNGYAGSSTRLELIGDAVILLYVRTYIMRLWPDASNGAITRVVANVVSNEALGRVTLMLKLHRHYRPKDVDLGDIPPDARCWANVYEAVVGAIYVDRGQAAADDFLRRTLPKGGDLPF